jgi:hypothetical protein
VRRHAPVVLVLKNITKELEERDRMLNNPSIGSVGANAAQTKTVYEDYKFLTRTKIDKVGIQNLVGTPLLCGYMHGFFVHIRLYNQIHAVVKPFKYSEYRSKKIRERMEEKRVSRVVPKVAPKAKVKVNPDLADHLWTKAGDKTKARKVARALVEDNDFGRLFDNPDFEIDAEAEDFKLRNPSGIAAKRVWNNRDMYSNQEDDPNKDKYDGKIGTGRDGCNRVTNEKGIEWWGIGSNDDYQCKNLQESDSNDDGFMGGKVREILINGRYLRSMIKTKRRRRRSPKLSCMKQTSTWAVVPMLSTSVLAT